MLSEIVNFLRFRTGQYVSHRVLKREGYTRWDMDHLEQLGLVSHRECADGFYYRLTLNPTRPAMHFISRRAS